MSADEGDDLAHEQLGAVAKRFSYALRAANDAVLRPFGLGLTQWAVLQLLATNGMTLQRDIGRALEVERATLSGIVASLVRKGLVVQATGETDQRQRTLQLSESGAALWRTLPDPVVSARLVAFEGTDPDDRAAARRVLEQATRSLERHVSGGRGPSSER